MEKEAADDDGKELANVMRTPRDSEEHGGAKLGGRSAAVRTAEKDRPGRSFRGLGEWHDWDGIHAPAAVDAVDLKAESSQSGPMQRKTSGDAAYRELRAAVGIVAPHQLDQIIIADDEAWTGPEDCDQAAHTKRQRKHGTGASGGDLLPGRALGNRPPVGGHQKHRLRISCRYAGEVAKALRGE